MHCGKENKKKSNYEITLDAAIRGIKKVKL